VNSCCTVESSKPTPCPQCGTVGPVIGELPVRPHRGESTTGSWQFCPNLECAVVYYLGDETVDDKHVITQVAEKATGKPTPICFCFAHTADDIAKDLRVNDTSTIQASVKDAVANGLCACEHLNPSHNCCLPDIHRSVKAAKAAASAD